METALTYDQTVLFSLIALVLAGLVWGRFRFDLVAFAALLVAVALGAVPVEDAFSGFGHEATIIVALVLVISAGLTRSGAVDLITRFAVDRTRDLGTHIALFGALSALLSAFMNNVAALALLMPVDIQAARKAGRSPSRSLMPLSFATILGGMVTLIGTPPNVIIAAYRGEALGTPFGMFDFAPVGAAAAIAGLLYIAFIGWRLIPDGQKSAGEDLLTTENYIAELVVPKDAKAVGRMVRDLGEDADEAGCFILGLIRKRNRLPGRALGQEVKPGDLLVVQGSVEDIDTLTGALGLKLQGKAGKVAETNSEMGLAEVVVTRDSRLVGRSANSVATLTAAGVALVGMSRSGRVIRQSIRRTPIEAGDILLLLGTEDAIADASRRLACLPLVGAGTPVTRHERAWVAIGLLAAAIAAAVFGVLPLPIALGFAALGMVLLDVLPLRELYESIEWPVIVLLGAMIPLGTALEASGGTGIIAEGLAALTGGLPPWAGLATIMIATMTLSDVLNNTATAVIAAPVAIELAAATGVSPDPYLMAVAVGASCAFLTPIGHKNNMLILGPGGYRFSDYWQMGLPLEVIIVAVSVPMILLVWPL
jgi:di/tricarboxylate transporter